jgi:hypothetical protein
MCRMNIIVTVVSIFMVHSINASLNPMNVSTKTKDNQSDWIRKWIDEQPKIRGARSSYAYKVYRAVAKTQGTVVAPAKNIPKKNTLNRNIFRPWR